MPGAAITSSCMWDFSCDSACSAECGCRHGHSSLPGRWRLPKDSRPSRATGRPKPSCTSRPSMSATCWTQPWWMKMMAATYSSKPVLQMYLPCLLLRSCTLQDASRPKQHIQHVAFPVGNGEYVPGCSQMGLHAVCKHCKGASMVVLVQAGCSNSVHVVYCPCCHLFQLTCRTALACQQGYMCA